MSEPIHGNYKNYYTIRQSNVNGLDSRMDALGNDFCNSLRGKTVLDIGCNEGKITIEIAQRYAPEMIHGVDIDASLVNKAVKQLKVIWSTSKPVEEEKGKRKRADEPVIAQPNHFPVSMPSIFGFVPFPEWTKAFPRNIEFKHADVTRMQADNESYDVILALSLTKWIHLNGGDEGIMEFFRRAFEMLKDGGVLVLEAQLTKSYQNAVSDMHQLKESFDRLKIDPSHFKTILIEQIGFKKVRHCTGMRDRGVSIYTK